MYAYHINTGLRIAPGEALSVRRNGRWTRAFFVAVLDTSVTDSHFSGDLEVRFEGAEHNSYIRPNMAHNVMVRSR